MIDFFHISISFALSIDNQEREASYGFKSHALDFDVCNSPQMISRSTLRQRSLAARPLAGRGELELLF